MKVSGAEMRLSDFFVFNRGIAEFVVNFNVVNIGSGIRRFVH